MINGQLQIFFCRVDRNGGMPLYIEDAPDVWRLASDEELADYLTERPGDRQVVNPMIAHRRETAKFC